MAKGVFGFALNNGWDDRFVQIKEQAEPNEFGRKVLEFIHTHTMEELYEIGEKKFCFPYGNDFDDVTVIFDNPEKEYYAFQDAEDFIKHSKECEYGYIINMYTKTFEFWKGDQTVDDPSNRYGDRNIDGYYPCRLMFSVLLIDIISDDFNIDEYVEKMENANMTIECFKEFLEQNDCDLIIEDQKYDNGKYSAELQMFSGDDDETDFPVEYDGTMESLIQEIELSLRLFDPDESAYSSIVNSVNPTISEMEYYCSNATMTKQICDELIRNIHKMFPMKEEKVC